MRYRRSIWITYVALVLAMAGCASPYQADQGALLGGVVGAGTGAVVGHALGNTGAGALVGAGVGAVSGAAIGAREDEVEARNGAIAAQQRAQQSAAAAMTIPDVISMTRNNVDEGLIINQLRARGLAAPVQAADVIYLQQQGVSRNVIAAMQTQPAVVYPPPPVMIDGGPPAYYYGPPPAVGVGFAIRAR